MGALAPLAGAVLLGFLCWQALKTGLLLGKMGSVRRDDGPILFRVSLATYMVLAVIFVAIAIARVAGFAPN